MMTRDLWDGDEMIVVFFCRVGAARIFPLTSEKGASYPNRNILPLRIPGNPGLSTPGAGSDCRP